MFKPSEYRYIDHINYNGDRSTSNPADSNDIADSNDLADSDDLVDISTIRKKIKKINKKLQPTFLEKIIYKKFNSDMGDKIMEKVINIYNYVQHIILIMSILTVCIGLVLLVAYFSSLSNENNTFAENATYLMITVTSFIFSILLIVILSFALDWLGKKVIGITRTQKDFLTKKKNKLNEQKFKFINSSEI